MIRILRALLLILLLLILAAGIYTTNAWFEARADAAQWRDRAAQLIAAGRGGTDLGQNAEGTVSRRDWLLRLEDPRFDSHPGMDWTSKGAGATTLTQSLAKRLAFARFRPGLAKLRQTGYALGLETRLEKAEILALFLDTVPMGKGPEGWMTGLFDASEALFNAPPRAISDRQFQTLIAVMIAPGALHAQDPNPQLQTRLDRVERLLAGECTPRDHGDIWLEGCATAP